MTPEGVLATEPKHVDVDAIERELAALWSEIAPPQTGTDAEPVTRACMSNLVIYCASPQEARTLPDEIGTIVERHPARVLLLVGESGARGVDASVTAVCHLSGTDGARICSEHVTIEAGRGAEPSLPATVRALLIGDLPSALWWASPRPPPEGGALFGELASVAEQVIWDSAGWAEPAGGLRGVRSWASAAVADPPPSQRLRVSDLAWRRLKPWRWLFGQTLDPKRAPGALAGLDRVELEHGPGAVVQAWLLVAWLAARLGWKARRVASVRGDALELSFDTPAGALVAQLRLRSDAPAELVSARVGWRAPGAPGAHREATFSRATADRLEAVLGDGPPHILAAPQAPRATLVARQLPKRFRDPVFRESLALARAMADAPAA